MTSDHYTQLLAIEGTLYFPTSEDGGPCLLLRRYDAGDCDTIPWPLRSEYASDAELRKRLASALYDERETNSTFGAACGDVLLPDGTLFSFEYELCKE